MVKDEADNVRAMLESARPHVDRWVIVDTGSLDNTPDIATEIVPWRVLDAPPIFTVLKTGKTVFDFAANRNRVLDLVEHSDDLPVFTIFLGGHETLHVDGDALRTFLEEHRDASDGAYSVEVYSGTRSFRYPRVLRVDKKWRYRGVRHEYPFGPNNEIDAPLIPGVIIKHEPPESDYARKRARILNEDLPILQEEAEDESRSLETRAGRILFLAETHAWLAADYKKQADGKLTPGGPWLSHQMASMALYWRYAELGNQPDKEGFDGYPVHYALALYYWLAGDIPWLYTHVELGARLQRLVTIAPDLPEARFLLAKHAYHAVETGQVSPTTGLKGALAFALEAARVAKAAKGKPNVLASDITLEWRSLLLAARCAEGLKQLADKQEDKVKRAATMRKLLEAAVKVGAPAAVLEPLPEAPTQEQPA